MSEYLDRGLKKTIDWKLVICFFLLVIFGWFNIYASVHASEPASMFSPDARSGKQFIWALISLGAAVLVLFVINPKLWEVLSTPGYMVVLVLLVAVIFIGGEIKGSKSWFSLGFASFQPAEISKITTSLMLSAILSRQGFKMNRRRDFLLMAACILVPMLTIVAEKETGSALVYLGFLFVIYREGFSGWWLFALGMVILLFILTMVSAKWVPFAVLAAVVVGYYIFARTSWAKSPKQKRRIRILSLIGLLAGAIVIFSTNIIFEKALKGYQKERIEVLLGLKEDIKGVGYNVHQSMIAIGSGGMFGKGYLNGTQTTYGFVPEQSTDFIFCTVGEEWGFIGCLFVIAMYVFLICRLIHDAEECRETFTRVYGYCVASCIFMHLFINIGMTIGLMPVIGIPLPLFSYGGSSLLSFTVMIFIFLALYKQEKKYF